MGLGQWVSDFHLEIGFLDFRDRRIVAAIEPDQQAGVMAKAEHLRAQGRCGDGEVLRRPVFPVLPVIAAAPAEHDKNAAFVGEAEKVLGFEFAFQTDGVEIHVLTRSNWLRRRFSSVRRSMSCDQPAPRMRMGLPFMRKSRLPLAVSSEVISRMPKLTLCSSVVWPGWRS